ncbi:NUDIX domain-containing protein [Erwinia sp. JUb26]|uniref:NUDIX hydrolase n=1 Tax=Erwinia sp. JUb26 TaxID=2485126 RepID=UPI000F467C81|nr:NUDIX domain-containing protein [Erwinia sp. JUb26]ROR06270.1 mutator protein MutT [Erwinia sp. JUb26]
MVDKKQIHIAAAVIVDDAGRLLLVRKRNTSYFMQPGGKLDAGESPQSALIRELREELDLVITPGDLTPLGQFTDVAANEPDHLLVADIFRIRNVSGELQPAAEIEEVRWVSAAEFDSVVLAPLTVKQIIPLVYQVSDNA